MKYHIKHATKPNVLLAIYSTQESAQKWIENFNPNMWMDKTMTKKDLIVIPVE